MKIKILKTSICTFLYTTIDTISGIKVKSLKILVMNLKICDSYSIILVVIYLVSNLMIPLGEGQLEKKWGN